MNNNGFWVMNTVEETFFIIVNPIRNGSKELFKMTSINEEMLQMSWVNPNGTVNTGYPWRKDSVEVNIKEGTWLKVDGEKHSLREYNLLMGKNENDDFYFKVNERFSSNAAYRAIKVSEKDYIIFWEFGSAGIDNSHLGSWPVTEVEKLLNNEKWIKVEAITELSTVTLEQAKQVGPLR